MPSSFFEYFGFMYLGPIDGHDIPLLEKYLNYCKRSTKPILLHILTKRARVWRLQCATPKIPWRYPVRYRHGRVNFKRRQIYTQLPGRDGQNSLKACPEGPQDCRDYGGDGVWNRAVVFEERIAFAVFDVGIAEEHAAVLPPEWPARVSSP